MSWPVRASRSLSLMLSGAGAGLAGRNPSGMQLLAMSRRGWQRKCIVIASHVALIAEIRTTVAVVIRDQGAARLTATIGRTTASRESGAMTRAVHVPYTVEQDEDGVWCAPAQLRPGVGASGEGDSPAAALEKAGFKVARVAGSHHIMRHPDGRGTTMPVHAGRDVARGTPRGILTDASMTVAELQQLL